MRVDPEALFGESTPADDVGHYLVMVSGAERGKRVEIGDSPVTIGRGTSSMA